MAIALGGMLFILITGVSSFRTARTSDSAIEKGLTARRWALGATLANVAVAAALPIWMMTLELADPKGDLSRAWPMILVVTVVILALIPCAVVTWLIVARVLFGVSVGGLHPPTAGDGHHEAIGH